MKIVLQAFIGSVIIHVTYLVTLFLIDYLKTSLYKPDNTNAWEVDSLHNKVEFGMVISPVFNVLTLLLKMLPLHNASYILLPVGGE